MLKMDINAEGGIVLRGVTDEAWEYIESERQKLYDADHRHWYFSRERFDGDTVYIKVTPREDKTEFLTVFERLKEKHGLEVSSAARKVLEAWRMDAENARNNARSYEERLALKKRLERYKRLLTEGCACCNSFHAEYGVGDKRGVCTCGEMPVYLRETVWSPIREDKYFPHEACKYLNER